MVSIFCIEPVSSLLPYPQYLLEAPALVDELVRLAARRARIAPLLRLLVAGAVGTLPADPALPGPASTRVAAPAHGTAAGGGSAGADAKPNSTNPMSRLAPAAAGLLTALVSRVPLEAAEAAAVAAGVMRAAAADDADTAAIQPVLRCAQALPEHGFGVAACAWPGGCH